MIKSKRIKNFKPVKPNLSSVLKNKFQHNNYNNNILQI